MKSYFEQTITKKTTKTFIIFFLISLTVQFHLCAQNITVKGKASIQENDFYYLSILSPADSSVIDYKYCDTPDFEFNGIKTGDFILQISSPLLYKTYSQFIANKENRQVIDVGYITLEPEIGTLSAARVTASQPKMKMSEGKMVFNVQNNTDLKTLGSLDDVLRQLPFVTVEEGKISLFGKRNTVVLVNGIPPKNNNWEMISPEEIKNIEVITNPSAEYSAQGTAVVNIITKRRHAEGFNGVLSSNLQKGEFWRSYNTLQLGYSSEKLNLFTNVNYNPNKRKAEQTYERHFPEGIDAYNKLEEEWSTKDNYSALFGFDYYINPKHTAGVQYQRIYHSIESNTVNVNNLFTPSEKKLISTLSDMHPSAARNIYDANYTFLIDSLDKKLTVNASYVDYASDQHNNISENSDGYESFKKSFTAADISLFTANVDYQHKTRNNFTGKAGLYYSLSKNDSNYELLELDGQSQQPNPDFDNGAKINENKFAAYVTTRKGWEKFYVSAGLRYEHVNYKNKTKNNENKDKIYNDLFPSLEFGYDFSADLKSNLSFSRKVYYPAFQDLDPSAFYVDTITYYKGNTNLQPEYSYNVAMNWVYKQYVTLLLSYSRVDDPLHPFFIKRSQPGSIVCLATTENLNNQDLWTASLTFPYQYKFWTMQTSVGFNYNKIEFESENELLTREKGMAYFFTYQGFKLPYNFNVSATYQYNSSGLHGIFQHEDRHIASLAASKTVLNDKLTLGVRYYDIFKQDKQTMTINLNGIGFVQGVKYDSSYISFSARYTFGSKQAKKYVVKENSKEEMKRIK